MTELTFCERKEVIKLDADSILKEVLISDNGCMRHCTHSYWHLGYDCCDKVDHECKDHSMYEIDYEKVIKDYDLKEGDTP